MVLKDHHAYFKRITIGIRFLNLFANDILLIGNNLEMIEAIKKWLSSVFEIKYMDEATYVIGTEMVGNRLKKLLDLW